MRRKGDIQLILDLLLATAPSSSIIVYASPQSLVTKATSRSAFLEFLMDNHHLLAMIVIDKIHLLTDFGRSFRAEITLLKDEFFEKVKASKPMLFLTATCTKSVRSSCLLELQEIHPKSGWHLESWDSVHSQ